ncbi:sugar phosphate nucleotidyltransferase [Terasakiella pusilla]|uniref:sugar phosphate nucleotidyltransferase n=1 Tax=Terasakiella pusilla TaxID=64973 RepID=UPI003AA964A1
MIKWGDEVDVLVLAGGKGTRLRPVLTGKPKILAPICNVTFFDILLSWLTQQGAKKVVFSLGYLADQVIEKIAAYDGGLSLSYVVEDSPLGTGGGCVLGAAQGHADVLLVLNGDSWADLTIGEFYKAFIESGSNCALAGVEVEDVSRYGQLIVDQEGFVLEFKEKNNGTSSAGLINSGAYLFKKECFSCYEVGTAFSLEVDFFQKQPAKTVFAYDSAKVDFIDIGVPSSLEVAQTLLTQYFPKVQR